MTEGIGYRILSFEVVGITDLMFGRQVQSEKKTSETHEQYDARTWKEKVWITSEGQCYLNPFAVTNSLVSAGTWLGMKVPGEGKKTYTDRFRKGVAAREKVLLFDDDGNPLTIDSIDPIRLSVPSDGKHGGPKRVSRTFPTLHEWRAKGSVLVFDGKITVEIFEEHLRKAGMFIGWGSMRVEGGGANGRFQVDEVAQIKAV